MGSEPDENYTLVMSQSGELYSGSFDSLNSALLYAKTSGKPLTLSCDYTITSLLSIDFENNKLILNFNGFKIKSDVSCLQLSNLGSGSIINDPYLENITAPHVFTW